MSRFMIGVSEELSSVETCGKSFDVALRVKVSEELSSVETM